MAGKRQRTEQDGFATSEETNLSEENEDDILNDDATSSSRQTPEIACKPNDTLETTLANLNNNMLTMVNSISTMSKALERFSDRPRPSKRRKTDEMSDSDSHSNDEANCSDVESVDLFNDPGEPGKNCLTQSEKKDDLLDIIANDLNADEQTDTDVLDKLATLVNNTGRNDIFTFLYGKIKCHLKFL